MGKRITITFKASGEGTLEAHGFDTFRCLGKPGFPYKREVTVTSNDKFENRWSTQYGVNMPWAILIHWQRGAFIHEMPATLSSNGGPTAGCIHLDRGDAERLWNWVNRATVVEVSRPW